MPILRPCPASRFELPPTVARAFLKDMRAFFAVSDPGKRDEIALRQMHALWEHQRPGDKRISMLGVKELFHAMRGQA
jgi:hypothetical protein